MVLICSTFHFGYSIGGFDPCQVCFAFCVPLGRSLFMSCSTIEPGSELLSSELVPVLVMAQNVGFSFAFTFIFGDQ